MVFLLQVVAYNSKGDSNGSLVVKLEMSEVSMTQKVESLKITPKDDDSVTLEWKAIEAPQGSVEYEIVVQAPQYYPKIAPYRTTNTSLTGKHWVL